MKRNESNFQLIQIMEHEPALTKGFAAMNHTTPDKLRIDYANEWRGRYGFIPTVLVWRGCELLSAMTPKGTEKYIRAGRWLK